MSSLVGTRGHRVANAARAGARRQAILLAAARVFAEKGYEAATLDDIADRLRTTKTVIYYHFKTKEDLIVHLRLLTLSHVTNQLQAIIELGGSPDEVLRQAVAAIVAWSFDELHRHAILLSGPLGLSRSNARRLQMAASKYYDMFRGILDEGVRQGLFASRDTRLMTYALIKAGSSAALWWQPRGGISEAEVIVQLTDQLMAGVRAAKDMSPV